MNNIEVSLIGIGLAMDAFAVSICKGLSIKKIKIKNAIIIGLWFGIFQALMPIIGYYLGNTFKSIMDSMAHLAAFILLSFIGGKMVKDVYNGEKNALDDDIGFKIMMMLAIATSIDALTVGVTFAFFEVKIVFSALIIGIITFVISTFGAIIGNKFGDKYEKKAQIVGGIILICLGIKNLLEQFLII